MTAEYEQPRKDYWDCLTLDEWTQHFHEAIFDAIITPEVLEKLKADIDKILEEKIK